MSPHNSSGTQASNTALTTRDTHTAREHLETLVRALREVALEHGRSDLGARLAAAENELANTAVQAVVVGQFKQGKSSLVNAIVAAPVCPVDDVIATSVPTLVRWGEQMSASLITEFAEQQQTLRSEIDPRTLRQHVTELAGEFGLVGNVRVDVSYPQPLLAAGLVLVDTPGFGHTQVRASTNLTLIPQSDIVVMVTDATQELTQPELQFLKNALTLCPRTVCVVSKTDLQHHWREIVQANTEHLAAAGIDIDIIETSAVLHELGLREQDASLRQDARIDFLAAHLAEDLGGEVIAERQRAIAHDVRSAAEHLALTLEAELTALSDPNDAGGLRQGLALAEESANELARRSARWQQTLTDGAGELVSDIEFDLRDRLREVGREAEQLIDASDPGATWQAMGAWLADSITQAVSDNFVWAHQRSVHLSEVVAHHFSLGERVALPKLSATPADQLLHSVGALESVDEGRLSMGQKLMIGLKGSYGGVLMFGLMTTLAGMALVNPISLAAGMIMGGFAYKQDAQQRVEQRRAEAKNAVRKLIDEAIFQVSKESRDRIGRIRRTMRDHFLELAEELKRTIHESRRASQQGAVTPRDERDARALALSKQLAHVRRLIDEAVRIAEQPTRSLTDRISA